MKKAMVFGVAFVCVALLVGGCSKGVNIFSPLTPAVGTLPATVENAANAYAAGDYKAAMAMYKAIVDGNPKNSAAGYGYVKSYVKNAGFDIATLIKNGSGSGAAPSFALSFASATPYYLINSRTKPFGIVVSDLEALYPIIIKYLGAIADGTCDGVIPANDVSLNNSLAFAHLLYGVFLVADPGLDGSVDYNFYDDGKGNVSVVAWGSTTAVSVGSFASVQTAATTALANSIKYLTVSIATAKGTADPAWKQVKDFLTEVYNKIVAL